jgi:hypothetical protein
MSGQKLVQIIIEDFDVLSLELAIASIHGFENDTGLIRCARRLHKLREMVTMFSILRYTTISGISYTKKSHMILCWFPTSSGI